MSPKMKFYSDVINENNQRVLFSCFGKMLNTSAAKKLPTHDCPRNLANMFADYFDSRVRCIHASFPTTTADPMNADQLYHGPELCEFSPTTPTELSSLIRSMVKKSCSLDPIPGSLMTDCFSVLLPVFVNVINLSFKDGLVLALYKEAVLDPVIKKDSLDHEVYQNYRPISNLRFVSKATEKIVALRITDHLEDNNLLETFQSAYKKGHGMETALTRINDDLLKAIDDNACVILVLLDLSAAFDTVDHQILLTQLKCRYGVKGNALAWMCSYLSNRFQYVRVANDCSSKHKLACGVPQGSVLGPILYSMYAAPIAGVIKRRGMGFHFYADDTQIYMSFNPADALQSKSLIEECIQDVQLWMVANKLKLNGDKTELLVLTARQRPQPPLDSITIGADVIKASNSAKNIGVWLDSVLSMDVQINNICKTAFFHLRNIAKIRKLLTHRQCEILIHAFISSKLDYCNVLLTGLQQSQINRLQHVQNAAARLLTATSRCEHVTPVLRSLHWLPVSARIDFKILLLVFKVLNGLGPLYLSELLRPYIPTRNLRSSKKKLLIVPKCNLKRYGCRAFSHRAPTLWNALPDDIRQVELLETFKSKLKTHLFRQFFH